MIEAKVIQVIQTVSLRGDGKSDVTMLRHVTHYWSMAGDLLAESDPCAENDIRYKIQQESKS